MLWGMLFCKSDKKTVLYGWQDEWAFYCDILGENLLHLVKELKIKRAWISSMITIQSTQLGKPNRGYVKIRSRICSGLASLETLTPSKTYRGSRPDQNLQGPIDLVSTNEGCNTSIRSDFCWVSMAYSTPFFKK